jgi:AcrR family transcriptional regulator
LPGALKVVTDPPGLESLKETARLSPEIDPRAERRRQAFVEMAQHAFFDKGFAGTSMSSIAASVGGSKTTLWNYFPSKEALFAAVVDDIVEHYGLALSIELPEDERVEIVLQGFGAALLNTVLSDPVMALHRLVLGEASRFPQLAKVFHDRGARRGQQRLSAYISSAMRRGMLRDGDATIAARQFAGLCLSGSIQLALLGIQEKPEPEMIATEVSDAVNVAIRAWGI